MAYITTKEVKEIRNNLKQALGKEWKLSVTCRHNSTVVIKVVNGPIDMGVDFLPISPRYIEEKFEDRKDVIKVLTTIRNIAYKDHWDESDSMTDYFHCSFFVDMQIGDVDKPYVKKAA